MVSATACLPRAALAQGGQTPPAPTTPPTQLAPVKVNVTRDAERSTLELPFAITRVTPDSARPGEPHLALPELLWQLPGITVADRNNPTQDPRISVRGFGARSQFGVRGIKILRDGFPLTLPDGQTPVDYLDLESVGSIEVIRGSASALYGNAGGGVIQIHTEDPPAVPFRVEGRGWGGSADMRRGVAAWGGTNGAWSYQGDASRTEDDGWRQHAVERVSSAFTRVMTRAAGTDLTAELTAYDMPEGLNPGALTAAQLARDPDMADPFQVRKHARKAVSQEQLGLSAVRQVGQGEVTALVYGGTRSLDNPLTFAIVDVQRASYGATLRGTLPTRTFGLPWRWSAGMDAQHQADDRKNFTNCNDTIPQRVPTATCPVVGEERGTTTLNQRELISGLGAYVRGEVGLGSRVLVSGGARGDVVGFTVQDHLVTATDPDASGSRSMRALSPIGGVVVRLTPFHSLYANVASAFETPTITELANHPDGSAGINPDLLPQYSTTYETGLKGITLVRVSYDVAAYLTHVRDELIPYEVPGGAGRTYYRNAGRTTRRGVELSAGTYLGPVEAGVSYTYSDFHFAQFTVDTNNYGGNVIPGVPRQQLQGYATLHRGATFLTLEGAGASRVWANDANSAFAKGYSVFNARIGGSLHAGTSWVTPVLGVTNVFDRRYVPSVAVNATGGKYYEPAPGRQIFAGITVGGNVVPR